MKFMPIILILTSLFIRSCGFDCIDKKTGLHKSSQTRNEAKDNGVFKFDINSNKTIFQIDSTTTLKIKNAWIENSWKYECINNEVLLQKDSLNQLVIDADYIYKFDTLQYVLMEVGNRRGTFLGSILSFAYNNQDTFQLTLQNDITKQVIDTIKFYR